MKFPVVKGSNLLRQKYNLPEDFEGEINLVFIPFWQWQQMEVNSWGAAAEELAKKYSSFRYYELPTIQRMNPLAHLFIDEGMRGGIPDPATRSRTITLYLDKSAFRQSLEMETEDHIYVFLVDRQGKVLWQARGAYQPETASALVQTVQYFTFQPAEMAEIQ